MATINLPTLRNNFSWTVTGNLMYALSQWGILVTLAKLGSPEMVGQYALGLAITAPVFLFSQLHLRAVQATDARQEFQFADYLGLRVVTTILALLGILMVVGWLDFNRELTAVTVLIALSKALESISDMFYGRWQQQEFMNRIALSLILRGVLSFLVLTAVIWFTGSLLWGTLGMVLVWAVILVSFDMSVEWFKTGPFSLHLNQQTLKQLIWLALPLGGVMMLSSLNANIPRYLIQHFQGEYNLGIFAALGYVVVAGGTIVNALGQSTSPRLAKYYAQHQINEFYKLFLQVTGLVCILSVVGIFLADSFGTEFLTLLYQPQYAQYQEVFQWLIVAGAVSFISSMLGYAITSARLFKIQVPFNLVESLVLFGSGMYLIPRFGLVGAAWSLGLASTVHLLLKVGTLLISIPIEKSFLSLAPQPAESIQSTPQKPIKILHILGRMQRGGAESRTLDLMGALNQNRFQFHFCTLSGLPGELDDQIYALGGKIYPLKLRVQFPWRFYQLLKREQYQVVHSHVHFFSGCILLLARLAGTPVRVCHFHSTSDGQPQTLRRILQTWVMRSLIHLCSTNIVAVSKGAMKSAWPNWKGDSRCEIIFNGVNTKPFMEPSDRIGVRQEFGLPLACPLFIHVGRMDVEKNHVRLISIFAEIVRRFPTAKLLLVGQIKSPIEAEVRQKISQLGLQNHVVLANVRQDVPRLLKAADCMLFPSLWEGLPGVVLEANVAGIPVLASDVPGVCEMAQELTGIHYLPLLSPNATWAEKALQLLNEKQNVSEIQDRLNLFETSPFSLQGWARELCTVWKGGMRYV